MFLLILCWFSVSVVDMHGRDAAATINNALSAITIHRRGLQLDGKFFDLHCRITDAVVAGGHFNDDYMAALGYELASLDKTVFEEVVNLMRRQLGTGEVTGFGQQPLLVADGDVYGLFLRLRTTLLFSLLRNYMGKFHMGCQHLLMYFHQGHTSVVLSILIACTLSQWSPWDRHVLCCSLDRRHRFTTLALLVDVVAMLLTLLPWWHPNILTSLCK